MLKAYCDASKNEMIDLPETDLATVRNLLAKHLPGCKVYVFGSRARGTAKPFSDLDLAVDAEATIPPDRLDSLREAFSESDLPILVDLVDLRTVSDTFRTRILETCQAV
jgi:uncharacterized protein